MNHSALANGSSLLVLWFFLLFLTFFFFFNISLFILKFLQQVKEESHLKENVVG